MTTFKVFKETAVPGSLQPNSIYLIAPGSPTDYLEIYVSDNAGVATKHTPTLTEIQALINSSLASFSNLQVVADIAARNALSPTNNMQVLVLNATGDGTVASGAATYIWRQSNSTWYKIAEAESMDVTLAWANIVDKPTSSAAAIDSAVAASHTHTNITQLNKIGEDGSSEFTYNGQHVRARLETSSW